MTNGDIGRCQTSCPDVSYDTWRHIETEKRTMVQSRRLLRRDAVVSRWILDYFRKQPRGKKITTCFLVF